MAGIGGIIADVANFANPYGTPSQGTWNLLRGVFIQNEKIGSASAANPANSVVFFYENKDPDPTQHTAVDTINDNGGRRLAVFEYPYVDGQKIADLGRRGDSFDLNIKFHGPNYQTLLNEFINIVVNYSGQGTLIHPVRGAQIVRFKEWAPIHRHDEWNAVTFKATFIEDNTGAINLIATKAASQDSALRSALQTLVSTQAAISDDISAVQALVSLPGQIIASMNNRLTSITGQVSSLLGQVAASFSTNALLQNLLAQSSAVPGGIPNLNSGTAIMNNTQSTLPPVYQVGFDPATQNAINAQTAAFVAANTITPQQAVFNANQARSAIQAAIVEVNANFGNYGYDIMLQYRGLAVSIQQATESAIAATQNEVLLYTTPAPMSLREVAFACGLTTDDQNLIENLNPYLGSVNYIPQGVTLTVPAA